jgi:hypothetical protein
MLLPKLRTGLICEDIRLEQRNLSSFMGVYGFIPDVSIQIKNFQAPVNFCMIFAGDPADGKFVIEAELRNLDETLLEAEVQPKNREFIFSSALSGSTFAFRFKAVFPGPNTYYVVLLHNKVELFRTKFQLQQMKEAFN